MLCGDIGAGTGILSRQIAEQGVHVFALEPNRAMRLYGEKQSGDFNIIWREAWAEDTGLDNASLDMACMASSFHWADFDVAVREFSRIIKPGGLFMALWNTRILAENPLLTEIEDYLYKLVPDLKRVSSGRSEFCDNLTENLRAREEFTDVLYLEGEHTEYQSPEHYVGLWQSVNDVRVQAGEDRFAHFIDHIKKITRNISVIEAKYLTRAWIAKNRGAIPMLE